VYLNLAEGLLWVQDVEGSNPFTPTTCSSRKATVAELPRCDLGRVGPTSDQPAGLLAVSGPEVA
jgi:hypothetical protein